MALSLNHFPASAGATARLAMIAITPVKMAFMIMSCR
jgi:hypothetical protein